MARGVKTGGRDIQPGQVLNPRGAAAHNPETKLLKRMTSAQVAEIASIILSGNVDDIKRIIGDKKSGTPADPKATPLQVWFATVVMKGIQRGDMHALNILLDRVVGKVKDKIELTGAGGGPIEYENMSEEQLESKLKELIKEAQNVVKSTE